MAATAKCTIMEIATQNPERTVARQASEWRDDLIQERHRAALAQDRASYLRAVKADLDTAGIAVLRDFFTLECLDRMREVVRQRYDYCLGGPARKALIGSDLEGTIFFDLAKSDLVQDLSNPILRPFGYQVDRSDVYPAMNILQGKKAQDAIHNYHFDATFLTLAVPVFMPDSSAPQRGSFRIWPNVRSFSTSWLLHKIWWRMMGTRWIRDRFRSVTVDFEPGSLYFFYGFRSWHGTCDLDDASLRANCLINVGGPLFYRDKKKSLLPRHERVEL
jgi:hypothetical protein